MSGELTAVDRYRKVWPEGPRLSHILAEYEEFWLVCTETLDQPRFWYILPKATSDTPVWLQASTIKTPGSSDEIMQHGASLMKIAQFFKRTRPDWYGVIFGLGQKLLAFRGHMDDVNRIVEIAA